MNERAMTLCELLSCKLALVSDGQLAEHWDISSATGRRHLTTWLNGLVRDDLIRRLRVLAKPTPKLDAPLLQVPRESPLGDMAALSWKLEKRWRIEPEVTTIYVRGPKCNQLFGGKAQPDISNLAAVSHDLALSALYFHFARASLNVLGIGCRIGSGREISDMARNYLTCCFTTTTVRRTKRSKWGAAIRRVVCSPCKFIALNRSNYP